MPSLPSSAALLGMLLVPCWGLSSTAARAQAPLAAPASSQVTSLVTWENLPPLPDEAGFAGMYAGTSQGRLLAAGGANFPEAPPWEGGTKQWHDTIFVLEPATGTNQAAQWRRATARLPRPLAYGVSVTIDHDVICLGGGDAERHYADCFALRYEDGDVTVTPLPPLPAPLALACGAVINKSIYLAGGLSDPLSTTAESNFWRLDLGANADSWHWEELPSWPGAERHLAMAAAQGGCFYLFGGIQLRSGADGTAERVLPYLSDAYCFDPRGAEPWQRIADLPRPLAAAPSPAINVGSSHILLAGGDDGGLIATDQATHPGFLNRGLVYHTITNTWQESVPLAEPVKVTAPTASSWWFSHWWMSPLVKPVKVTAPTAMFSSGTAIVSGEIRPGVRSPAVELAVPASKAARFGTLNWVVLVTYLGALVAMGFYFSRRERSTEDFFLAGRRIPWWAAGLSIYGTQLSAITFMAIPAVVYEYDWTRCLNAVGIVLVAPLVVFFYLPHFRRVNITTAYEYLEERFGLVVRLLGSLMFITFQIGRMGIVLLLPSIALAAVTGIDVEACILIMGVLCTIYTVLGGIEAVIWTDVLQVFVLVIGATLALGIMLWDVGGPQVVVQQGWEAGKFHMFNWSPDITQLTVWVLLIGGFFTNLAPYTTDQAVVQRYLTTRTEQQAARGIWANALLAIPTTLGFFFIGTALWVYYHTYPERLPLGPTEQIFPAFIVNQLPAGVAGLVIAGVFAAAMSSLDSSMNSVAAAIVNDFYRRFRPQVSDHSCLRLARWLTLLLGVIGMGSALLLASIPSRSMYDQFMIIMGMLGGGLSGVFALGVFTRRANTPGVVAGLVAGVAAPIIVWQTTRVEGFLYGAVGVLTSVIVGYGVSLLCVKKLNKSSYY